MSTFNATLQRSTVFELSKKKAPSFQKPLEIASFSYDEQRRLFHDDRSLTEYHEPFPKDRNGVIDLNRGIEDWVTRDEEVVSKDRAKIGLLIQDREPEIDGF